MHERIVTSFSCSFSSSNEMIAQETVCFAWHSDSKHSTCESSLLPDLLTRIILTWTPFWKNSQICGATSSQALPMVRSLSSSSNVVLAYGGEGGGVWWVGGWHSAVFVSCARGNAKCVVCTRH